MKGWRLKHVPEYCAIIGSGIIGLEFADVYTALGAECTVIEALPKLMPAFDREIDQDRGTTVIDQPRRRLPDERLRVESHTGQDRRETGHHRDD